MNALTPALEKELFRLFEEADQDRAVRVITLTGTGSAFCAGYAQGNIGRDGRRPADPSGKSVAEMIEFWHRQDGGRIGRTRLYPA
jgi:enoyl-CoA hydratase/carnithine racemase